MKTTTELTLSVDATTAAAIHFVLEQAAQDRTAHEQQLKLHPPFPGSQTSPAAVPTFVEVVTQALRIGARALAQGALQRHEQDDVPVGEGDLGFVQHLPYPRARPCAAHLAPGRGLAGRG